MQGREQDISNTQGSPRWTFGFQNAPNRSSFERLLSTAARNTLICHRVYCLAEELFLHDWNISTNISKGAIQINLYMKSNCLDEFPLVFNISNLSSFKQAWEAIAIRAAQHSSCSSCSYKWGNQRLLHTSLHNIKVVTAQLLEGSQHEKKILKKFSKTSGSNDEMYDKDTYISSQMQ